MLRRLVVPALLAAGLTAFAAAPASAADAPDVKDVANELKSSNIYVDPATDTISDTESELISQQAENAETPVYVVVLEDGTVNSRTEAGGYMGQVQQEVGDGTYLLMDGRDLVADSTVLSDSAVNAARDAATQQGTQVDAANAFIQKADSEAGAAEAGAMFGMVLLGLLVAAVVGGGFFMYSVKKKREAQKAKELAEIKQMATEDVVCLGEDIARLEIDLGKVDDPTRADYTHAMDSYDRAKNTLDTIQRPEEIQHVTKALEDGRYYMTATRARLNGEPVPERRGPCFFNPQHGPSQQDVLWAPPGGSPRTVTACANCAQAVLAGFDPDVRMVEVDGQRRPYYDAGPAYAPYAGGYHGSDMMMGMFTGMMMGSMMGSMMGGGFGAPPADVGAGDAGGGMDGDFGDGEGWGDFGGGGFDGGDFGGFGDF
ncbi:outer membrane lipoprotein SlyB [Nocardiopsis mwathae]|uniref:Outer membrane lipoprotein SlyB n=1 Tax=Nocardiopsis mwathae TaxID=1472723 RepID=A0A7X0D3C2_9ACTN|nr:chemotaxis protein CheA [Nocardiopsis mwathae]MBB6170043.1 outer membrane lipoprotein SlyB [Nocardiopsis mwathae]